MTEIKKICSRRTEVVEVNGKEVIFKGITLGQLRELSDYKSFKDIFENKKIDKKQDESFMSYLIKINDLLKMSCGLDIDDIAELDGDQLKEVYEIFKDVNQVFFAVARSFELKEMAIVAKGFLKEHFQKIFAYWSAKATAAALTMDTSLQSNVSKPSANKNKQSMKP